MPKTCLSQELLAQFLHGSLSPEEGTTVTDHLRDCETCVQTLRTLESKDSFFKALQDTPAPAGGTDEFSGIEDLKNRVKAMGAPAND